MAITNASRLADWGSGIGTEGAVLQVDNTNNRLGVGTTNPQGMLQVGTGITMYSTGIGSFNSDVYVGGDATVLGNLNVTGDISYDEVSGRNLVISEQTTTKDINVTGVATAASFSGDGSGLTGVASTDNIITSTASTFTGSIKATGNVNISGITTVGVLSAYNNVNVTGIVTATSFSGSGSNLTGLNIPAGYIELDGALFN